MVSPLTLTVDLNEPAVRWRQIALLPSGDRIDEIGIDRCYHCERTFPAALAVAPDGSFWIADRVKHRIAHFGLDGSFLEAIATSTGPADLAFVGDRLYVLLQERGRTIARVTRSGGLDPIIATLDGKARHVQALVGGQERLTAVIAGAQRILGRYWAVAYVDPQDGNVSAAPGVASWDDTVIDVAWVPDERPPTFEIRWLDGGDVTRRHEITLQAVRDGAPVRTTVGDTFVRTATPDGVAAIGSIRSAAWYLEIPAEGGAPVFERIPHSGFIGDLMRYLTVGPDGVYWMRLLNDGLHIYRR